MYVLLILALVVRGYNSLGSLMAVVNKVTRVNHDGPGLQNMQTKFYNLVITVHFFENFMKYLAHTSSRYVCLAPSGGNNI